MAVSQETALKKRSFITDQTKKEVHQHCTHLTASHKGSIAGVSDAQYRVSVRDVLDASRRVEGHLLGSQIRVLLLSVFQLHVGTELVPGDGALRCPVNLHEQRINLLLLVTASISYFVHFVDRIQNTEHFTHPIFQVREITAFVHAQKAHVKKNNTDNVYIAQIEQ